jgi:ankyrin repeat protein
VLIFSRDMATAADEEPIMWVKNAARTTLVLALLAPASQGCKCNREGKTKPDAAKPARPTEPVKQARRSTGIPIIDKQLGQKMDPAAKLSLQLSLKRDLSIRAELGQWLPVYVKYHQLINARLYQLDPDLCKPSVQELKKKVTETVSKLWKKVKKKPSKLLDRKSYALIKGISPLHLAAIACQPELMESLFQRGAKIDARDPQGFTPLHYVSCEEAARVLLRKRADVHAKSESGLTPLHMALTRSIARRLVRYGAKIDARDKCGNTPLHLATAFGFRSAPGHQTPASEAPAPKAKAEPGPSTEPAQAEHWIVLLLAKLGQKVAHLDKVLQMLVKQFDVAAELIKLGADPKLTNNAGNDIAALEAKRQQYGEVDWDD